MGHNYRKPAGLADGFTQISPNTTVAAKSQLDCMTLCKRSKDCFALSYDGTNCALSSVTFSDLGPDGFEDTGNVYMEWVHPLLAQAV